MELSSPESVSAFIFDGTQTVPKDIAQFVHQHSAYPQSIWRLLGQSEPGYKTIGLVRVVSELCAGLDTAFGSRLGSSTILTLLDQTNDFGFDDEFRLQQCGALASSVASALYDSGSFAACEQLAGQLCRLDQRIASTAGYWDAASIASRSCSRQ